MLHGILAALLSTFIWVGVQNLLMHVYPPPSRFWAMVAGYVMSLPLVYAVYLGIPSSPVQDSYESPALGWVHAYVLHLLLFAFYGECFFHVERSVTLRLLCEILDAGENGAHIDALRSQYPVSNMVAQRLEVLRENGFLEKVGRHWQLRPRGRILAKAAIFGNWLFLASAQNERD
jgi:hypothetical protein